MKHLYRITWSDGTIQDARSSFKPYQLFDMYAFSGFYPVVIERL